jgi:hypothetical protein
MRVPALSSDGLPFPPVFEIAGDSMKPSLLRGWRVRVIPLNGDPEPGAIVLFDTRSGHLIHRALHTARFRDGAWVFHQGDAGGRFGLIPTASALGRVAAIISPADLPLPTLDRLTHERRAAFYAARLRARIFSGCRGAAHKLGLFGTPAARVAGCLIRWLLTRSARP